MKITRTHAIRLVSVIALISLILPDIYNLYPDSTVHTAEVTIIRLFSILPVLIAVSVPLLYDILRSDAVKYYTFAAAALLAVFGIGASVLNATEPAMFGADGGNIVFGTLFCVLFAALLVLTATVWKRHIRPFYGTITALILAYYLIFVLILHLLDAAAPHAIPPDLMYTLRVIYITLAMTWCMFRSWSRDTFAAAG